MSKPEVAAADSGQYCTMKELCQINGCKTDMDDVSLLNFICQEFQLRPNWEFIDNKVNELASPQMVHVQKFTVKLDFNGQLICTAEGRNKKDAKFDCAKRAICLVAPKVFAVKYSDENVEELKAAIERDNLQVGLQLNK